MKWAMISVLLLTAGVGGLSYYVTYLRKRLNVVIQMLSEQQSRQRSLSASYGRITEQWFPLMKGYPYDSANFRFLGTPVDGVQFEEDRVIFIEFKSHKSELSAQQKRLKKAIQAGNVTWEEYHFQE